MTTLAVGLLLIGAGLFVAYRSLGWIWIEEPISEQRKRAFGSLTPKYRRTQAGKKSWWHRQTRRVA